MAHRSLRFVSSTANLKLLPEAAHMPTETKADPFKPKQPAIPGVPAGVVRETPRAPQQTAAEAPSVLSPPFWPPSAWPVWLRIALASVVVVVVLGLAWRARVSSAKSSEAPTSVPAGPVATAPAKPTKTLPVGPGEIATAGELAKPWSSKQFLFRRADSEKVPALAVRLPGGALWGISLREPYGTCELEYVTDLSKLLTEYNFHARHPMVVNPCSGSVYDLAQYTGGPNGLVRGQVVHGTAIRAPFAIEIVQHGKSIKATRME
jgi:hypothetical protein